MAKILECPKCAIVLERDNSCSNCRGLFAGFNLLNRVAPAGYLKKCLTLARETGESSTLKCPACAKTMSAIFIPQTEPPVELDFCLGCNSLWFDDEELKKMPKVLQDDEAEADRLDDRMRLQRSSRMMERSPLHQRQQEAMILSLALIALSDSFD